MTKKEVKIKRELIQETIFPDALVDKLESIIPGEGKSLYDRYVEVINDFRLEQLDKLGVDAGKFVEEFVKVIAIIEGLVDKINLNRKKSIKVAIDRIISSITDSEEKELMLNIAYYSIYRIRNKRDAAHINSTPVSPWDARHIVETSTWLLQELLRIYTNLSRDEIINLFYPLSISLNHLKAIEYIDGKLVPLIENIGYNEQILLVLLWKNECIKPIDIIETLPNIKDKTVYNALYKLSKNNLIVKIGGRFGCYKITSKGRQVIFEFLNFSKSLNK